MAAPTAALTPRRRGSSSQRQPTANARNRTGPDLPELHGVDERERQAGEQQDPPAHRPRDRQDRDAREECHQRQRRSRPRSPAQLRSSANGSTSGANGRRVEEEPEATGLGERHVVERRAVRPPARWPGDRPGSRSRACRPATASVGPSADERQHGEDRQSGPRQPDRGRSRSITPVPRRSGDFGDG